MRSDPAPNQESEQTQLNRAQTSVQSPPRADEQCETVNRFFGEPD
jgi:hypothetical protein